jgi:hypothetical protein
MIIFFVLRASQSIQPPSMPWGGSPAAGAPPTWLSLPPAGLWPPTDLGFWHPPQQSYPGQPSSTPPSQTGQGY